MKRNTHFIPAARADRLWALQLPDCVYLTEHCRCGILQVDRCVGAGCSFCQTGTQQEDAVGHWARHMNDLSEEKQIKIATVYYSGKMPWKQNGKETSYVLQNQ